MTKIINGSCLCGLIKVKIKKELRKAVFCHCTQCQKANAEFSLYTKCSLENVDINPVGKIKWYKSSKHSKRGFCPKCGSSMFFQSNNNTDNTIAISTGILDKSVKTIGHIYTSSKKTKVNIDSDLRKFKTSAKGFFDQFKVKL